MKIAIDTQALFSPVFKGRGIAKYVHNQLLTLFATDTENEYILFNIYSENSVMPLFFNDIKNSRVTEFQLYTGDWNFLLHAQNEDGSYIFEAIFQRIIRKFIRKNKIDVFYIASVFDFWDIYRPDTFENVRTVATVYDIVPHIMASHYLKDEASKNAYYKKIEVLRSLDKVEAISQSVKDDLVNHLGFDANKIDVIYSGIEDCFTTILPDENEQTAIKNKFGIEGNYIFCAGGTDMRKNMPEMVSAYASLPASLIEKYQLVIVCKLDDEYRELLLNTAHNTGLDKGRLVLTDYVTQEELVALYQMAYVTLFASQYEGFGLPVIESMACGTPVVTSNNSSLGEIARDGAILVDPFSVESIAKGLEEALTVNLTIYKAKMGEKVKTFTWKNTVSALMESLASLPLPDHAAVYPEHINSIACFTPLPPQGSGIADYAEALLQEMAKYTKIDIYVDDGYKPMMQENKNIRILPHSSYPEKHSQYDYTLYQIGNSEYHNYMVPYLQKYRGVVELHDSNLHLWLYYMTVKWHKNYDEYERLLAMDYPAFAHTYAAMCRMKPDDYDGIRSIPVNGFITNYADSIIVHSDYARKALLQMDISRPSTVVPHFAKPVAQQNKDEARSLLDLPKEEFIFASFGAVAKNRRLDLALKAFAQIEKQMPNAKLYITGEDDWGTIDELKTIISTLSLQDKVVFSGRLTLDELFLYYKACDVVINLRDPYYGETSGVMINVLSAGTPAIVSDIGSFAEIPDNCCIKLPTDADTGPEQLAEQMLSLYQNSTLRAEIGKNATAYALKTYALEYAAKGILKACCKKEPPVVTEDMLRLIAARFLIKNDVSLDIRREKIARTLEYCI